MTVHQIATLLQIIGVLLVTFFGGMLLARDVLGNFAKSLEYKSVSLGKKWQVSLSAKQKIPLTPKIFVLMLIPWFYSAGIITCAILSLLYDNQFLEWLGKGMLIAFVTVSVIVLVKFGNKSLEELFREVPDEDTEDTVVFIFLGLMSLAMLFWLLWLLLLFLAVFRKIWSIFAQILVKRNAPRIFFLAIGGIMLLAGLVLEFIETFQ